MLTSPGAAYYDNDILGNRLWRNWGSSTTVQRYLWDGVGRMRSVCGATDGARYQYRADGMRVMKVADLTIAWQGNEEDEDASGFYDEILAVNKPTTRYYYDGQMAMEDDFAILTGGRVEYTITRYGIGARGIDFIGTWIDNDLAGIAFPIYDGHGNQIATIGRASNNEYVLQNARTYDVWGSVRSGSSSGFPSQRYCANLGHVQDDESDLIYMRARYYEPWTGRFVSEDQARDGYNWYRYVHNNPVTSVDPDGRMSLNEVNLSGHIIAIMNGIGRWQILNIAAWADRVKGIVIGIGRLQKVGKTYVDYSKFADDLIALARANGANFGQIYGNITSRGGERVFQQMLLELAERGAIVQLEKSGILTYLYWLLE